MSLPAMIVSMLESMDNLTDIRVQAVIAYSRGNDEFNRFVTELDAKLEANIRLFTATVHMFYDNYRDLITINGVTYNTMEAFWTSYDFRAKRLRESVRAVAGVVIPVTHSTRPVAHSKRPAETPADATTDKVSRVVPPQIHPSKPTA